ncbi:phosphodiester glycosidase family protein [Clostridium sp.]|uniref:phosphodiester glycosidase family protein n=1 Tax=Clostridium sp. TaxID=1506 RepID=UPI00260D7F84|nr:phosphodiester glycosidase family protein [Clostridium sp.]
MNTNKNNKNIKPKSKVKIKKGKKNRKKINFKTLIIFFAFEMLFTACTFPFMILYGPFESAKSTYVGAAMTSGSHQFLVKWFMSDAKIAEIQGQNSVETNGEKTDLSQINIPKIKDDTIEIHTIEGNSKYNGYYMVIKDPTRVKIGVTSKLGVEGETTSQIAEENGAIAAINGGGFVDQSSTQAWTGNGGLPTGVVMTGGKVVNDDLNGKATTCLGITKEGKMMVGDYTVNELKEQGVQEAVSFTPALIIGGKKLTINGDGGFGIAPKTAIGQRQDGAIILMVIDGREIGSFGATVKEVQEIMYQLGAINAINLDGGKSTTMYYDGDIINKPSNSMGERTIATAIIVK